MGLLARIRRALAGSSDPELVMREQYREFQGLLEANDAALERIAALSELLSRMEPFTAAAVAGLVEEILGHARRMVLCLVSLSGGRHAALHRQLDTIVHEQRWSLAGLAEGTAPGVALPLRPPLPPHARDLDEVDARAPGARFATSPVYHAASAAAAGIIPLGLADPSAVSFTIRNCRTIHDVTRFCHEMAMREMFDVNSHGLRTRRVRRLVSPVPLHTSVIDLGDGLSQSAHRSTITPEEITSVPFRALLAGMCTPGLRWSGAVPIELRGFAGLVLNSMIDSERAAVELGSEAFTLVSPSYVNYSARMGYHFASVDAYASASLHRNYISYRFKGGAAATDRRIRRARFIEHVLRHWGFAVNRQADRLDATIRKLPEPDILSLLRELGRLLGAVRNADVSMYSDEQIALYAEAFLAGSCSPVEAARARLRERG